MTEPRRILIHVDSGHEQSLAYGLGGVEAIYTQHAAENPDVVLLTHTKHQLESTGLSRMLGGAISKVLASKKTVKLPSGATMRAETMQTLKSTYRKTIVFVFYGEPKILDFVDGLRNVLGVVVVAEIASSARDWQARWNPQVPGQPRQQPAELLGDPVAEQALAELSRMMNLGNNGLYGPYQEMADQCLRILRAKGHKDISDSIRSWAIRNKWQTGAAADLEKIAKKIWQLKTKPSLAAIHEPDARYRRWTGAA